MLHHQLKDYQELRGLLLALTERLEAHHETLDLNTKRLERGIELLRTDTFKLLVVGQFNCGKSTLINALLGEKKLPAFPWETTALVCELKWGERPEATLYLNVTPDGKRGRGRIVPHDNLEAYVTIDAFKKMQEGQAAQPNGYASLVLTMPYQVMKNGIEIIDSPGLNGSEVMENITQEYAQKVDEIIYVFSADRTLDKGDRATIERFRNNSGYDEIILVVNKIDQLEPQDRDRFFRRYLGLLRELTSRGEEGVFFLSSKDALDGRLRNDQRLVEESNVPSFERYLAQTLYQDTGRIRLDKAVKVASQAVDLSRVTIKDRRTFLGAQLKQLEERTNDKAAYDQQIQRIARIKKKVDNFVARMRDEAEEQSREWFEKAGDRLAKSYSLADYLKEDDEFRRMVKEEKKGEEAIKNLQLDLQGRLKEEYRTWATGAGGLDEYLTKETESFVQKLQNDKNVKEFAEEIGSLRVRAGGPELQDKDMVEATALKSFVEIKKGRRDFERVLANASSGFAKRSKARFQKVFADIALFFKSDRVIEQAVSEFGKMIKSNATDLSRQVGESVAEKLNRELYVIHEGLEQELERLMKQLEKIAELMKTQDQARLDRERESLDAVEKDLGLITSQLKTVKARIATLKMG